MEYSIGDNITLEVGIVHDNVSVFIQSIGWFYNDSPICVCSCSSHYILSNDSKSLTIVNASAVNVGTYEARATGYIIQGYSNELCDKARNELLEYYAAFAPVTYTLSYKGKAMKRC